MKAITFDDFGGADVLHLTEVPLPELRPDDILVKVMASGVNRADLLQREGVYGSQSYGDSPILGLEISGEVVATGSSVVAFAIGDRVMGIVGGGAYAEYARLDSMMAAVVPDGMSFTEAAAVMESLSPAGRRLAISGRLHEEKPFLCTLQPAALDRLSSS